MTKGSFYWHFTDRRDLLMAVLAHWKEGRIRDIIKQTRAQPGRELEQIYHVIDVYSASRSRRGMMIELAVRDWARRDAEAGAIVAEVDDVRLRCARDLFLACGVPMDEASSRCMLLYAYVFGVSLMIYEKFDRDVARLKRDIADLIARSCSAGIPGAAACLNLSAAASPRGSRSRLRPVASITSSRLDAAQFGEDPCVAREIVRQVALAARPRRRDVGRVGLEHDATPAAGCARARGSA